jgi:hypothetical protein
MTKTHTFIDAPARAAKSQQEKIIGGGWVWGQKYVIQPTKFPHQSY